MTSKEDTTDEITKDNLNFSYCHRENSKLIQELINSNLQERKFLIFKLYYDRPNIETIKLIEQWLPQHLFAYLGVASTIAIAKFAYLHKEYALESRKAYSEVMSKYNSLLGKMACLSKELDLNNSLEISILFSYLLWKGYLSKTKENKFESENRKMLTGLYFADIMDGRGVCLNHCEMLKDFLSICGYSSVMLMNYASNDVKITRVLDIKRKINDSADNVVATLLSLLKIVKRNNINHIFNLIEEDEKLYIYDATNLSLHSIDNSFSASIINGGGRRKLYPYQSYNFCLSERDCTLMDKLLTGKITPSPYTKEDFISIGRVALEIMKNSHCLFEDFYTEARPDIMGISEETDKIKARIRT